VTPKGQSYRGYALRSISGRWLHLGCARRNTLPPQFLPQTLGSKTAVEQATRVPLPRRQTAVDRYICTGDIRLLARWHVRATLPAADDPRSLDPAGGIHAFARRLQSQASQSL